MDIPSPANTPVPEVIYRIQAGNSLELIRDRKTDDLGKLWEWLLRYQDREGVKEILIVRHEIQIADTPLAMVKAIALGEKTLMLALRRENEESPWTEIAPLR
jgi:hypothetical protein